MTPLPLGITLALSLTCAALPLSAQGTYVPGSLPASSGTRQDPTDMYLEALKLVTQATELVEKRDYVGAIRLTQQAEDKFGRLAKSYPQWRPNLLQTRRQLNRENLEQWQKLAQQQAAAVPSGQGLELERPVAKRPRPKPNIALPPGYQGVEFPVRPGESLANTIPSPSVFPETTPEVVESNYERIRRLLDKTTIENKALIQALKRTRKEQEDILAKLAVASAGESVYRDELLKVRKQMEDERKTSNNLLQTLTRRVEELEQKVTSLSQDKARYLAQIGEKHAQAKPLSGFDSAGVLEVVENDAGGTYRAVYTVRFQDAVYVLHCFQKKSRHGIATPKPDMDLIRARLKMAEKQAKEHRND